MKKFGRGLNSIVHKSECMLYQFLTDLERKSTMCLRKSGILRVLKIKKTHLATIARFLTFKYNIEDPSELNINIIKENQQKNLMKIIKSKMLHSVLFKCCEDQNVDINMSTEWLVNGNNSPISEAMYCIIQDRNIFFNDNGEMCNHCNQAKKSVDHMATRCSRMLNSDYTRRHNEVIRCIHLHLCRQYGIRKTKRLKSHTVQSVSSNHKVEIRVDTTLQTDVHVKNNRPDIFVLDKTKNEITLIEVGITSHAMLKQVEVEKLHKYDLLAGELSQIHGAKVTIIPIVLTWDGIVSKFYKSYMERLKLDASTRSYIQSLTIKKTLETMLVEHKHGVEIEKHEEQVSRATNYLLKLARETTDPPDLPEDVSHVLYEVLKDENTRSSATVQKGGELYRLVSY
ncbi:uncharacterized protein LOC115229263 [Octopus sinensis]|uniref:Uncharacterized protein LOC115229263 n=1 Tax=Octopus sinensis TaxID=2607531 RepID=A0A6P7TZX9_9MOLL|nr:uncharacterized protein LOC115229263 [Octopus sinensis]